MSSQTTSSEAEPGGGGTGGTTTSTTIKETPSTVFTEQLISDYVEYLKVDCSLEIRGDTTLCLYKTMPEIEVKASEMQRLFVKIDQLEELVTIVSKNVSLMEEQVNKAEAKMGSFSGIKKMITSLVSPKHSAARNKSQDQYHPPEIFNTSDFFPKQS
ncbi:biogenesis of lysosome-related organelles complex 1 subunit 4 isoform X2 [Octopus sinensis]|uniref:Biogenesis of lysosome-related organelles complex 1 subunit 4 isoform X2 n=1 Tax=Octopus sinensis TaxID=2607531 RepID=A0A7E6EVS5_9MOLL|nr:biogenesis of lysosome-related organelles complex 1 subunit 4 isoform X2 [Octopus sinensis]